MKSLLIFFYPFLFLLFPALNVWSMNFLEVKFYIVKKILASYFCFYAAIYLFLYIFTSEPILKISLSLSFLVIVFYKIYPVYRRVFNGRRISTKISNFFVLLLIAALPFIAYILPLNINIVLTKIFICLCLMLLFIYILSLISKVLSKSEVQIQENFNDEFKNISKTVENLPNIYFIIPDSYSSNNVLKKYYDYDNYEFENWLKSKSFKVYDNAKSNYNITNTSVASTLNFDYLKNIWDYKNKTNSMESSLKLLDLMFNSKTVYILKKLGYKYFNLRNFWAEDNFYCKTNNEDVSINIYKGFRQLHKAFFFNTAIINIIKWLICRDSRKSFNETFNVLEQIIKQKTDYPKFVLTHLICPHEPFYFDKDGNIPDKKYNQDNPDDYKTMYAEQVQYLNKKLQQTVSTIINNDPQSLIIIQADHGGASFFIQDNKRWHNPDKECIEERFSIFRAIYCPFFNIDLNSSINLFRIILNNISNTNFPFLEDYHVFHRKDKNGFFVDVITLEKNEL